MGHVLNWSPFHLITRMYWALFLYITIFCLNSLENVMEKNNNKTSCVTFINQIDSKGECRVRHRRRDSAEEAAGRWGLREE